jgi:alpha-tubulin suppressor-like RCC1 family protein
MECGVELALGREHSCRRFTDGAVKCWGNGDYNALGRTLSNQNGFGYFDPVAAEVEGVSNAIAIATAENHGCAITSDALLCWGSNQYGQLGDGTTGTWGPATTVLW